MKIYTIEFWFLNRSEGKDFGHREIEAESPEEAVIIFNRKTKGNFQVTIKNIIKTAEKL